MRRGGIASHHQRLGPHDRLGETLEELVDHGEPARDCCSIAAQERRARKQERRTGGRLWIERPQASASDEFMV
jgi:hypothetical protein